MIFGLSGYARSGKDSLADRLVADHGFVRLSFADELRRMALAINPIIGYDNLGQDVSLNAAVLRWTWDGIKPRYPRARVFLQKLGEQARLTFGEDAWVLPIERQLWALMDEHRDIVITDVRYVNEARMVTSYGGALVRLDRPGFGPANNHVSEVDLDGWDFTFRVPNIGTLEDLGVMASALVRNVGAELVEASGIG